MLMSQVADLPTTSRPVTGNSLATIPPGHMATTVGCAGAGNACFCVPVSSSARGRMLAGAVRISPQREGPANGNGFTVDGCSQVATTGAMYVRLLDVALRIIRRCARRHALTCGE
jgi:hypothetical protein